MYEVYCDGQLIYNTKVDDKRYILHDAKLDLELNKAGSFEFIIYPHHAMYNFLYPLKSIITVYQDDYLIFRGRVLNTTLGFHNEKQVFCEGELAFLCDSVQKPCKQDNKSIADWFDYIISQHNVSVDNASSGSKMFKVGNAHIRNDEYNSIISRFDFKIEDYTNTWDTINETLIKPFGGYLWVRHKDDGNYIDYISDFGTLSNQPIKFGKNLLSLKKEFRGEDVATVLIPLGKDDIDIKKVNNGLNFIKNDEAIKKYGWIERVEKWDDITSRDTLLSKAKKRLKELSEPTSSIEISAADLSSIEDYNAFHLGTYVTADSSPHELNANFIVKKLQITLAKPSANKLTLDGTFESFTQATNPQTFKAEIIKKTNKTDENLNAAVSELRSEYTSLIEQANDEIALKVSQTDFNELGGRVSSVESTIKQQADEIALKVSQTDFDNEIDNVEAKLNLSISTDKNGVVQSAIGAEADTITFNSNKLIIDSTNFKLNGDGTITATAGKIADWDIVRDGIQRTENLDDGTKLYAYVDSLRIGNGYITADGREQSTMLRGDELRIIDEIADDSLMHFATVQGRTKVYFLYVTTGGVVVEARDI